MPLRALPRYVMSPIQCAGCGGAVKVPGTPARRQVRPMDGRATNWLSSFTTAADGSVAQNLREPGLIGSQRSPGDAGQFEAAGHLVDVALPEAVCPGCHGQRGWATAPWPLLAVLVVQAASVPSAHMVQYSISGRGSLLAGRAPGMGSVAAPNADPELSCVLLRGARYLPATWRSCGQYRRPCRRARPVAVLHARGHEPTMGHDNSPLRSAGSTPGCGIVRYPRWHTVPGRLRDL